jgi:hypothetical protein
MEEEKFEQLRRRVKVMEFVGHQSLQVGWDPLQLGEQSYGDKLTRIGITGLFTD